MEFALRLPELGKGVAKVSLAGVGGWEPSSLLEMPEERLGETLPLLALLRALPLRRMDRQVWLASGTSRVWV
jgi:hypothetical protein